MIKNLKFKIYPTEQQVKVLENYERELRKLWNASVAQYRESIQNYKFHKFVSDCKESKELSIFDAIRFLRSVDYHPRSKKLPACVAKHLNKMTMDSLSAFKNETAKKPDFILLEFW